MKRFFTLLLLGMALASCQNEQGANNGGTTPPEYKKYADADEIKVMSFNVRVDTTENDEANNWSNRKASCLELIADQSPDIIGFQEARYTSQWKYIKDYFASSYDGFGVDRSTGKESGSGETMGVLYKRATIEKIEGGTFWLSETPDTPSKGWGANHYRTATWGIYRHKATGVVFCYINTHLDHQVKKAQVEGMKLIAAKFLEYEDEGYPLFLSGDLNVDSSNEAIDPIRDFMWNTRYYAPSLLTDFTTTINGYNTTSRGIIDHIFCTKGMKVVEYHTINERYGTAKYVSDHYPIYAIMKIKM